MNGGPSQYARQVIDVAARQGISTGPDIAAMNACLAEQQRYNSDADYARACDADRARSQADVHATMDRGIARFWANRKVQGEAM